MEDEDTHFMIPRPSNFAGVPEFLVTKAPTLPADTPAKLSAGAQRRLARLARDRPEFLAPLAHMVASMVTGKAKTVRQEAVKALAMMSVEQRAQVLPPFLKQVPSSQALEVVEFLRRADGGEALLTRAVGEGAKLASLVQKIEARQAAIDVAPTESTVLIPPFHAPPEPDNAAALMAELKSSLARVIERGVGATDHWRRRTADEASKVTQDDLRAAVGVATGARKGPAKVLEDQPAQWFAAMAPSLTLVQVVRLWDQGGSRWHFRHAVSSRLQPDTDLRAVEDALRVAGVSFDLEMVAQLGATDLYPPEIEPGASWPWFAEHPDVLEGWLAD